MNDLYIENPLDYEEMDLREEQKIEISFLDEYGEGKTYEDKIIQDLVFTCEEGFDYRAL